MKKLAEYTRTFLRSVNRRGLKETIRLIKGELAFDRKYKTRTAKIENLENKSLADHYRQDFHIYQGASYFILQQVFSKIPEQFKTGYFVDCGCGKAKAMIVAAEYGFTNLKGIEIAAEILEEGRNNLLQVKSLFKGINYQLYHENVVNYIPADEDLVFYFFNPFGEKIMKEVIDKLLHHKKNSSFLVIYINPLHVDLFLTAGFKRYLTFKNKQYPEAEILIYD